MDARPRAESAKTVSRAEKAAIAFSSGQSRRPYRIRKEIVRGMAKLKKQQSRGSAVKRGDNEVCQACKSLLELQDLFKSFYHSGSVLRTRKAVYKKAPGATYYDVDKQNKFLLQSMFDSAGNYLFHRDCIRATFGVSNQRLVRLGKSIQSQKSLPTETVKKSDINFRNLSDVVLPRDCDEPVEEWLKSLPDDAEIEYRKHPERHGNACKKSNNAKSDEILQKFLKFIDGNSAPNGRKEGSHGKTFYFD